MSNPKFIIPARFNYPHIDKPVSVNGGDPKYSICAIVSKNAPAVDTIKSAIDQAARASAGKWGGKIPADLKTPLRDGDAERPNDPAYENSYFMNLTSQYRPRVVDRKVRPLDPSAIYSGCYGLVSVTMVGYDFGGTKGVSARLGNIQFVRDGEPLY